MKNMSPHFLEARRRHFSERKALQMTVMLIVDTCPGEAVKFVGKRGIFITGSIKPKLSGVTVTVSHKDGTAEPIVIETPESGEFK